MYEGCIIRNESVEQVVLCLPKGELQVKDQTLPLFEWMDEEREEAYKKGKDEGERIGYAKAGNENSAYQQLLQTVVDKLLEQKKGMLNDLKPEIIEFSLQCAQKVIRMELANPEQMVKLLDAFLMCVAPSFSNEFVKVYLSAEDLVMMEEHLSKVSYDRKEIKGLRFVLDPLMQRGDCRVETKTGLLNFMVSRELEDLRSKILKN